MVAKVNENSHETHGQLLQVAANGFQDSGLDWKTIVNKFQIQPTDQYS